MLCILPEDRLLNIKYLVNLALSQTPCTVHLLMRVLGICNAARMAVPLATLRSQHIQRLVLLHYSGLQSLDLRIVLSKSAVQELRWWSRLRLDSCKLMFKKVPLLSTMNLATDASDIGWSYLLDGHWVSGQWTPGQSDLHINHKEFLVLAMALEQNARLVQRRTIYWEVDNTTALAYIRNEGGTKDWALCLRTIALLEWCHQHSIHLIPKYVPSIQNIIADRGSRFLAVEDWFLLPRVTRKIFNIWGTLEIDLMATARSAQVPAYFAFDRQDKFSRGTDTFA